MLRLIEEADETVSRAVAPLVELGLHHEQQHQELILMDIKHVFSINPLLPAYQAPRLHALPSAMPARGRIGFAGGLVEIGHARPGFAFDNEGPRHKVWLDPFPPARPPGSRRRYLALTARC